MDSENRHKEILDGLAKAVVDYQEDLAVELAGRAVQEGVDALDAVMKGLAAGMRTVGELYDRKEYFVPEILLCADALYRGLDVLRPHLNKNGAATDQGQVVIGSVKGDVHDIGKNLVAMMLDVAGFTVHDLGTDVPISRFIDEQQRTGSDIVALSSMMTTTMMGIKGAIAKIKEHHPEVSIMIGGAPVTLEVAELFGADGYAESAGHAVQEAFRLISQRRQRTEAETIRQATAS